MRIPALALIENVCDNRDVRSSVSTFGACYAMLSRFRRRLTAMSPVDEIDQELRKIAKALRRERFKAKAYGGQPDTGRWLLLIEDADDLLDRRLMAASQGV